MLMWEAMELSSCPRVIIDSTGKGEITMKKALILALAACLTLTCSACAFTPEAALVETPQFSDNHAVELDEPPLPEEITDGASDIYTSWLDSGRGYLLKKGFPAAGQMPCTLYRTEDGESWTRVRSLSGWELTDRERESGVIRNYPKALFFWDERQGLILTDYHGYDECVYLTQDGGESWNPLTIELPPELLPHLSGYSYLEGEKAWTDAGNISIELSAHFENREPISFVVQVNDGTRSEYFDEMGSELITFNDNEKTCNVVFGVYKISAFQETVGEYDQDTGVLIFSAKDAYGKTVSAEARKRDDYIVVTIIDWDYEDYLPNGTELVFYKRG
jgi:hypothetical protein